MILRAMMRTAFDVDIFVEAESASTSDVP
jgi:hypothetical protein